MPLDLKQTPILRQLIEHTKLSKLPLHVPGHHQGRELPGLFAEWLGSAPKIDLTELPGLDNLHSAEGCILESQTLAASHYGSQECFYSVNGSTACIMAAIAACAVEKKRVLMVNPFHLSAWRGLILAEAIPVFLPFEWVPEEWTFRTPDVRQLREKLKTDCDFAAIYVTSPTYQGKIAPVREIVNLAHEYKIPVIVDEAHGAHLGLIAEFPEHSVSAGADVVIQSVHKTLPSLTQTAWVHVQGKLVFAERVREQISFLQTTSPSYLLLASLDVAQAWLRLEGADSASKFMERRQQVFTALENGSDDPLRCWIPIGHAQESERLNDLLKSRGIYVEFADMTGILAMFGFSQTSRELERFQDTVQAWRQDYPGPATNTTVLTQLLHCSAHIPLVCTPKAAGTAAKRKVSFPESIGEVSGTLVTPYPPGVPVLWPGQRITSEFVAAVQSWRAAGTPLQGIDGDGYIDILTG